MKYKLAFSFSNLQNVEISISLRAYNKKESHCGISEGHSFVFASITVIRSPFFLINSPNTETPIPHDCISHACVGDTCNIRLKDESASRMIVSKVHRSKQLTVPFVAFCAIAASLI